MPTPSRLTHLEPSGPPRGAESKLGAGIAGLTLKLDAATAEVVGWFDAAGIPSILLKGPAFARWLYAPGEVRRYDDVDLLVPDAVFEAAVALLAGRGFRDMLAGAAVSERPHHASAWYREIDGVSVDLHRTVLGMVAAPHTVWRVLLEDATELMVGGRPVAVASVPCRAVLVALHAIQHGPGVERCLDDVRRALRVTSVQEWRQATVVAARVDATAAFAAGLRLLPEGRDLADRLGLGPDPSVENGIRAKPLAPDVRAAALGLERLRAMPSWLDRVRLVTRLLVPSPGYLRVREPLARGGPVGLFVAYLWRPIHLFRSVGLGLRELSRVRREVTSGIGAAGRAELLAWCVVAKASVGIFGFTTTIAALDRVPKMAAGAPTRVVVPPATKLVGSCLHRSVARSQYLRVRGRPHEVVIGVAGAGAEVSAHAWLSPFDDESAEFEVIARVPR